MRLSGHVPAGRDLAEWCLAGLALGGAALVLAPLPPAYTTSGEDLAWNLRHFRVHAAFQDPTANDNQTPHPQFPAALGATQAIWKGCVEWGTRHGDGTGDPSQPGDLGSGGSNLEVFFAGETSGPGGVSSNVHSPISSCSGGLVAYTETPISDGWRIRYCENWTWDDGPGTTVTGIDLQGIAAHEFGHAIGLGHSTVAGATMGPAPGGSLVALRSIEADDAAGAQAIYGVTSALKPRVQSVQLAGGVATILGSGFSPTGNVVWFTEDDTAPDDPVPPIQLVNVPSSAGGTRIDVPLPPAAAPGHVAVRRNSTALDALSNPWPFDPSASCMPQVASYCVSAPNSVGAGALIGQAGSTSVSANDFTLLATGLPPHQPAIFYYGDAAVAQPFGNGVRCVGGSTFRLPPVQASAVGDAAHALDFTQPPADAGPGAIGGGTLWRFQCWYRDPAAGGAGFNLSDGLEVTFCW